MTVLELLRTHSSHHQRTITHKMPVALIDRADRASEHYGVNRSELIRLALERLLDEAEHEERDRSAAGAEQRSGADADAGVNAAGSEEAGDASEAHASVSTEESKEAGEA